METSRRIDCGCKPGTYETGWHEVRCAECVNIEMDAWREMISRWETEGGRHVVLGT